MKVTESVVFFVLTKDSPLRMILDARRANRYSRRPLVAPMVTSEGSSNVELDLAEPDRKCFMASGDLRNALGLVDRRVDGRTLTPSDSVSPFPASLPMVFSWSMYLWQDAALRVASESGIPRCVPVISDRRLPVLLPTGQGEGWSHGLRYNYAGQLRVVSDTEASATEAYNMIAKAIIRVGLQVHDEVRATCDAETSGVRLRLDTGVATLSTEREWRLRSGCREIARRKRTCGRRPKKIMGHPTFCFYVGTRVPVNLLVLLRTWRSVRVELQTFSSLVPCLETNLRLPWAEICYSSDASLTGGAASVHDVPHIGRLREKRRLKSLEASTRLREHALSTRKTDLRETFNDNDDHDRLELLRIPSGFEIVGEFVEVPRDFFFLGLGRWSRHSSGTVMRTFLPSKPGLRCTQHATLVCESRQPSRILFLLNNLGLVLALEKNRSSHNFTLNSILPKLFRLQVLYGHWLYFRCIPSELNSGDARSRFFSHPVDVPDNPTTTKTSSVLRESQVPDDTRNRSITSQRWVFLAMRLLEHHEEFAERFFAVGSRELCNLLWVARFLDGMSRGPQECHLFATSQHRGCRETWLCCRNLSRR